MQKKSIAWEDEVVTKGYLRDEFKSFKTQIKRELRTEFRKEFATKEDLRNGLNGLEFRMINRMDTGFAEIREEMKKQTNIFQILADQVIGEHKNFEVESISIKANYGQLEERVKKMEEVVFPSQA